MSALHASFADGPVHGRVEYCCHVARVLWLFAIIRVESYVTQARLDRKSLLNLIGKAHHVVLKIILVEITFGKIVAKPDFKLLLSVQRAQKARPKLVVYDRDAVSPRLLQGGPAV